MCLVITQHSKGNTNVAGEKISRATRFGLHIVKALYFGMPAKDAMNGGLVYVEHGTNLLI